MRAGDFEIVVLNDGPWLIDGSTLFGVTKLAWEKVVPPDETNRFPTPLNCTLIKAKGVNILVDTGIGDRFVDRIRSRIPGYKPDRLLGGLRRAGVEPEDVRIVINTHLHRDHAGGNLSFKDGKQVPTFPNAEYWIQKREWEFASRRNELTSVIFYHGDFLPLKETGQARVLEGKTEVAAGIKCVPTRGHTPGHQSVFIDTDRGGVIVLGDACQTALHLENLAWSSVADLEPIKNLATKKWILRQAARKKYHLIFYHEPRFAVGQVVSEGDKYRVVPVG